MNKYINADNAVSLGFLQAWYQHSVSGEDEPIWTDEHLRELTDDFILIPKETPAADVKPIKCGQWEMLSGRDAKNIFNTIFKCSECGAQTPEGAFPIAPDYCPNCGADMMRMFREKQ